MKELGKEDNKSPHSIQRESNTIEDKSKVIIKESQAVIEENKEMSNTKIIQGRFQDLDQEGDESIGEFENIIKEGSMQGRKKYSKKLEDIKCIKQEGRYFFRKVKERKKETKISQ